jgi:nitric oxide reductase NorQ protein
LTTAKGTKTVYREFLIEEYVVENEPYYVPVGDEIELFEAAYAAKIPVLLKGPTGCGKTRFIEHMAWRLGSPLTNVKSNKRTQYVAKKIPI